ncbi:YecR family lipoprotein [Stenotrophomonas sp.]|uniref:YecR family lipoprotein n=1 Tax=Stenotrophomonas sp. TaxID=69392 RepID=UPI0028A2B0C2|nr:YecR family lipoprotein [Stenotrophomonas sp.]
MKKVFAAAMVVAMVAGCTTTKDWTATGGSRSDGVVRLSYEQNEFERVVLNENQAISLATRRCATWGYTGAEAFGGVSRQCAQMGGFGGCASYIVTKEYQCTGQGSGQAPSVQVPSTSGNWLK